MGCVLFLFPAVDGLAAEYIREEHPVTPTVQPAVGGLDHAFDAAPKRPDSFLGRLSEHLSANVRAYDYRQDKENNEENMASVIGGSLGYHTGHWRDRLGFGATVYTSQKIWGPQDKGGTGLLKETQNSFTVLGEAYAELKFDDFEVTAFRREMDLPYINKEDIRQVPITHESYMIGRRGTGRDFAIGHVTQIKKRDEDSFISMSEAAGVADKDKGVSVAGSIRLPGMGDVNLAGAIKPRGGFTLKGSAALAPAGLKLANAAVTLGTKGAAIKGRVNVLGTGFDVSGSAYANGKFSLKGSVEANLLLVKGHTDLTIHERGFRTTFTGKVCLFKKKGCKTVAGYDIDTRGRVCIKFPKPFKPACIRVLKKKK